MPLLGGLGFRKGDILQPNELRDLVVAYSQSNVRFYIQFACL